MTDHMWDGRPVGGRRRKYKIAGCSRSLFPSIASSYADESEGWTPYSLRREREEMAARIGATPDMSFEEYVERFWDEDGQE